MEGERLLLEHATVIVVLGNLLGLRPLDQMSQLKSKLNTIIECCHLFCDVPPDCLTLRGSLRSEAEMRRTQGNGNHKCQDGIPSWHLWQGF